MDSSQFLEHLLPEETLNNLIRSGYDPETLNSLLQVKLLRINRGSCEKFNFSIDCIYNSDTDVALSTEVLKTALDVAQNCASLVSQAISFCLEKLHSSDDEVHHGLKVFNVVLEYYISENNRFRWSQDEFDRFQNGIITILNGSSKLLITFVLVSIIPNFVRVIGDENRQFLPQIFENCVIKKKNLEILCVCYDNFVKSELNETDFNLIKSNEFWFLLMECLTQHDRYLKKQAVHLLSKSVEIVVRLHNSPLLPAFLNTDKKIWANYVLLLNVPDERQLHIVEPSLCLFNSMMNLDFLWRSCVYRIFLKHPQDTIANNTVIFILQNETEWQHLLKIITDVLRAINRNHYNAPSAQVFRHLGDFCNKLQNDELEFLLRQSLKVSWIPAAIWSFYNNIFNDKSRFQISSSLLDGIIKNLKLIPHKFIRNACANLVINYFTKTYRLDAVDNLLKVCTTCRNFDETLFKNFITRNGDQIRLFADELRTRCVDFMEKSDCVEKIDNLFEILRFLQIEVSHTTVLNGNDNQISSEEQILNGVDLIENVRQIAPFLRLCRKHNSEKLLDMASDILEKHSSQYNNAQKIIAFDIMYRSGRTTCTSIIEFWNKFLESNNIDEEITQIFVEHLLESLDENHIQECIVILESLLDSQNATTVTILENLTNVLTNIEVTIQFVARCFGEFVNLIKSCGSRRTTSQKFLSQMFRPHLLQNGAFCERLCEFSRRLLQISNGTNALACILCENIADSVREDAESGAIFIPVIVELILHGIVTKSEERVDYHVCQQIRSVLQTENDPNSDQMLTRLLALDSMLVLTESRSADDVTNNFIALLTEKYMKYFSKRHYPDSQMHLEKLRILQALILLIRYTNSENPALVELIIKSFIVETHQPSVRVLLQFLLILLVRKDSKTLIRTVCAKLKTIDNNKPSTVTGLIPVLYHLMASQDEAEWDRLVEILLPYTMGAQFKLRIYAQVALDKIYKKAIEMEYSRFLDKYQYLYNSLRDIIEATCQANHNMCHIYEEFFDFSMENCDFSTILYTLPKKHGVTNIEWDNLTPVSNTNQFKFITFSHTTASDVDTENIVKNAIRVECNDRIQKKMTPWQAMLNAGSDHEKNNFILVASLVEKPANLGGLTRTCEVFGIEKMIMRNLDVTSTKEFQSLSMSAYFWVSMAEVRPEELQEFVLDIKAEGYRVVGAEQTSDSVPLERFQFPKKTVLVLGNEKTGIPADLIPLLDQCIEIRQFGLVRSLNVHVAGAVVMWEYCKQHIL